MYFFHLKPIYFFIEVENKQSGNVIPEILVLYNFHVSGI